MPRRREVQKRDVLPDPKYGDKLAAKFINALMRNGKKSTGEMILYDAFDINDDQSIRQVIHDPLDLLVGSMQFFRPLFHFFFQVLVDVLQVDDQFFERKAHFLKTVSQHTDFITLVDFYRLVQVSCCQL